MSAAPPELAPVDPAIVRLQEQAREQGCASADPLAQDIDAARAQQDRHFAFVNRDLPTIDRMEMLAVPADGRRIAARAYWPAHAQDDACIMFLRGAGWWAGGLDSHEGICRATANATGRPVVAIDYRRSPEHHFPAQRDDAVAVATWLASHAKEAGLGPGRLVLWGESAGASLSVLAWSCLQAAGLGAAVRALVLFYGNLGGPRENLRKQSKWVWRQYLGPAADAPPEQAIPAKASLAGCPPVWLGVGDADPLIEDTLAFAERLRSAGVAYDCKVYPGMPHAFSAYGRQSGVAARATDDAAAFAQAVLQAAGR